MRKIFLSLLLVALQILTVEKVNAQQCLNGGCSNFGSRYPSGTFSTTSSSWSVVNTAMNAGNYTLFSVTDGNTYQWSYCESYGGVSTAWDAQLTLYNNSNLSSPLCFSTDACGTNGNAPYISWVANFTGTVRLLTTAYSSGACKTNSGSPYNKLVWRQSSGTSCTPPSKPTGFTATAVSSSQINLSWNSVSGAIGYDISYCDGTYIGFTSNTSYSHTGRSASTTYSYKISAQKSSTCVSPQTSCVNATTLASCTPPSAPTGLTASAVSSSQINLSWNSVSEAIGYDISYCDGTYIGFTSNTSYSHTGRSASTTYSYKISAQKSSTCVSPQTSCVNATTSIDWSGYTWNVSNYTGNPGNNHFLASGSNIWKDVDGNLHLKIIKIGSNWYCSQIQLQNSLGYGEYTFQISSNVEGLDKNIVLGLFTYETDSKEIDIEFSRWGDPAKAVGWYTVQPAPYNINNQNSFALNLTGNYSTHKFIWNSSDIFFQSYHGHYANLPSPANLIKEWKYTGSNTPPEGNERLLLNFWLYNGIVPSNQQEAEVIIKSFTFKANTPCTAVSIGTQPQNQTATVGSTATFSVSPNGTAPFLYSWYKNNVKVPGANNSSYTTPMLTSFDNGNIYKCIITNCNNSYQATSNNATLTVNSSCTAVTIDNQPQNQTVNAGGTATFSVSVNGTAPFLYFWYKNGVQIPGASNSSYTTPPLTTSDNGNYYYCLITNCNSQNGTSSNRANLTVNTSCTGVTISSQPQNQTGAPSASASFTVTTTGTSPSYEWQHSSDGGSTWNNLTNASPYSGATSSTLNIYPVSTNISGHKYRCMIGGSCTTTFYTNAVSLTVQNKLWINKPLANDKYNIGQTFQINWGDFINNTSAIGQSAYVQKKYKIELSNNNGSSWSTISDEYVINNAISGQNNNNFNFTHSINVAGAYKIRITDKDNLINFNISESFTVATNPSNGFTLSLHWDKSSPAPIEKPNPIGLAADGTCRILLKLLQKSTNTRQIAKINATIKPVSDSYAGTDLLGKILYSTSPNTYSEQGNNANSITTEVVTNQGLPESWFWLVAPDDFTDNLNDQRPERKINVEFWVTYTDNSTETVSTANSPIEIVRPILFLVHGNDGSDVSFNEAKYNVDGTEKFFDKQGQKNPVWKNAQRLNLYNYESFIVNAEVILGINVNAEKYYNSFQSQLKGMHNKGYACNKVDYVAHSMGGCVARAIINHSSGAYTLGVSQFKNYGKGFINKLITINSPHNGSQLADLALDRYQYSPITAWYSLSSFVKKSGFFVNGLPSPAAKNLQGFNGGISFRTTNVKNHLIGTDLDINNNLSGNYLLDKNDWTLSLLYSSLLPPFRNLHNYMYDKYNTDEFLSNSDIVVPISSQLTGKSSSDITDIANNPLGATNASIMYGESKSHLGIQRDITIGTRVMRLLNAPINSSFFANSIAANPNPNGTSYRLNTSLGDSIFNFYDTSHIRIARPARNDTVFVDSTIEVQIKLKEPRGLQEIKLIFQNGIYSSISNVSNQTFNFEIKSDAIGKNILIAQAIYDSLGFTINHIDTITVYVRSLASLNGFYVSPKSQILNPKQIFQPDLNAVYNNYVGILNNDIDLLNFTIADTNVVRYDSINFQFIAKDTGTTHILFNYKGFIDTAFVYLSYNEENANITNLCPKGNTSFSAGVNDPTKSYQWQVDAGNGYINVVNNSIYSGATTSTLTLSTSPTSLYGYSYRCIISDGIGSNITTPQTLKFSAVWTGVSNNAWENVANWNCSVLPDENTDVIINSGMPVYPVVNSNVSVRSLTLKPSATIIVDSGYTLNIKGKSQ